MLRSTPSASRATSAVVEQPADDARPVAAEVRATAARSVPVTSRAIGSDYVVGLRRVTLVETACTPTVATA